MTYTFVDLAGCQGIATTIITVNDLPTPNPGTYNDVCEEAPDVNLVGLPDPSVTASTTDMGTWSGIGVTNINSTAGTADFDPSGLSGPIVLTYTYLDENGCSAQATTTITVDDLTVNPGTYPTVCEDVTSVSLNGIPAPAATGEMGTWTGPFVTDASMVDGAAIFDPSAAGTGTHTLTYTFMAVSYTHLTLPTIYSV